MANVIYWERISFLIDKAALHFIMNVQRQNNYIQENHKNNVQAAKQKDQMG